MDGTEYFNEGKCVFYKRERHFGNASLLLIGRSKQYCALGEKKMGTCDYPGNIL